MWWNVDKKCYTPCMKVLVSFLITYLTAVTLIISAHFQLSGDYREQVAVTKSEIHGLLYLRTLYKLGINVAKLNNTKLNPKQLQKNILLNISDLYSLQKRDTEYINPIFNEKLEQLKYFKMTNQNYYDFLEQIGLENYRIGDVSKLLFERDRKIYFLSSLATHYMPEYLISNLINHNIIQELQGDVSFSKENIFAEQTKLIYLSAGEIYVIIKEVSLYEDSKLLLAYMSNVMKNLTKISQEIETSSLFNGNDKNIQKYLEISHEILTQSYLLNDAYMQIIANDLNNRLDKLKKDVFFLNIALSLILLLISALFLYAYRLYRGREQEHISLMLEQKRTQEALDFRSQFLSNMSHEIRTPLNAIVGLIRVVLKTETTPKQSDILNKINHAGDLLLGVVNDILDMSKIESGKLQIEKHDFELKTITTDIKDMFTSRAEEKNIDLKIDYVNIHNFDRIGDSLRISQILINFISNAIKFTSQGEILFRIKGLANNQVTFEVKDSGIGIKEEHIKTLFDEFTQADVDTTRKYGGTGLGLAISKNLVEMMGGEISVTSEYGSGSTFSFTIELLPSQNTNIDKVKLDKLDRLEDKINKLKNITILVAEDNKMNQSLLVMLLEDSQLRLEFAKDGAVAVEMFQKKDYDLILMDIQMPNMNGYEATQKIRELNSSVPIIALSANVMQEDIEKSQASGMNAHLAKPIDLVKLYTELLRFLKP